MEVDTPEGTKLICYADDLAVLVTADTDTEMMDKANETLKKVSKWMEENKLKIAPEKTTSIILNWRWKTRHIRFRIGDVELEPSRTVQYLGITMDRGLTMGPHVANASQKATRVMKALCAILPNIGGPTAMKRRVLAMATQSIVMYGSPVWNEAMRIQTYRDKVRKVQRIMALRVCFGYRTISTDAVLVLSGLIPMHILSEERKRIFDLSREGEDITPAIREAERIATIRRWQREWENPESDGRWTYRLIPDLNSWLNRKWGEVNYCLTQALSGHGCFGAYLHKIGKKEDPGCKYCGADVDDAEHTFFRCPRWDRERANMNLSQGRNITVETMIEAMIERKEAWKTIESFITKIVQTKEKDDKR